MRKLVFNNYKRCFSSLFFLFFLNCIKAQSVCTPLPTNAPNYTTNVNFTSVAPPFGDKKYYTQGLAIITASKPITTTGVKRFYSTNKVTLSNGFKASSSGSTTRFVAAIVDNCSSPINKHVEPIDKEDTIKNSILLFPNPTETRFTSIFNDVEVSSLYIYSIEGKQIYFQEHLEGQKELEVEVSQLPEGVYTVIYLTTQGEHIAKKFIKIKG